MNARHFHARDPWTLSPPDNDPVEAYLDVLIEEPAVQQVVLFSRRALGTNVPRGRVDLALRCRGLEHGDFRRLVHRVDETAWTLVKLNAVNLNGTNPKLAALIERTGRTVFDRAWGRLGSVGPFASEAVSW